RRAANRGATRRVAADRNPRHLAAAVKGPKGGRMQQGDRDPALESLKAFVGEWSMEADFPGTPPGDVRGRTTFEWMTGERFLVQRWEVPHPDAPDGIAVITLSGEGYLQHYFDSRGVARLYEMSVAH